MTRFLRRLFRRPLIGNGLVEHCITTTIRGGKR